MQFTDALPFVRFWCSLRLSRNLMGRPSAARDCRLFVLLSGKADFRIRNGQEYSMDYGSCLYIPAGVPYEINGNAPRLCIVNFDFTQKFSGLSQPLPLVSEPGETILTVPEFSDAQVFSQPFFLPGCQGLLELCEEGEREFLNPRPHSRVYLSALLLRVLVALLRSGEGGNKTDSRIETMADYVAAHYRENLRNADVAAVVGYHPNYANALFQRYTGETIRQYLLNVRLQKALGLLLSTDLSIGEIALSTGFSSQSRFARDFAQRLGYPPSAFRARYREKP